jgi:membrane protein implicated in regulation of membrane protease activity
MLRNTYLMTAFFMMLYALFMAVPSAFVTLSWIIAACVYFLLSILMRNVKYRYMAMGTMIATAFYLFLVDLAKVDLVVRIFAFLFLSILSIAISVFYVRRMKGKQTAEAAMGHSPDR